MRWIPQKANPNLPRDRHRAEAIARARARLRAAVRGPARNPDPPDIAAALEEARAIDPDVIFVTGSLSLVAEARSLLLPEDLPN
jgi:folylpolyglutamate synthase/dihydropteroate synthase